MDQDHEGQNQETEDIHGSEQSMRGQLYSDLVQALKGNTCQLSKNGGPYFLHPQYYTAGAQKTNFCMTRYSDSN